MTPAVPLVSVVVATYASGPGLDRLVASLDAQTLASDRFEVIFVDDGSPDGTLERVRAIAAVRPNVRVERIENSGWPSRPRNVGLGMARGEWVLFMDHDDELYPDALRAASHWGARNGADVVNGKEARTHDPGWALATYRADRPQDRGRRDAHPLVPMNPHKLYRREFLEQHGIRFPEGRRVLWEDIFFNLQVAEHATTISTLATTPFYHWVQTKGSGSTTFRRADPEWWSHLERVVESIEHHLAKDELQRRQLLRHQYATRVLPAFQPSFLRRPASEQEMILDRARAMQQRYFPVALDASLDRSALAIARALRLGDDERLRRLCAVAGTDRFGPPKLLQLRWEDGALVVRASATTVDRDGGGTFAAIDGRVLPFPPDLLDGLGDPGDFDVRDELERTIPSLVVRARGDRIGWELASTETHVELTETDGRITAGVTVESRLDPASAALGEPLGTDVWDVFLRTDRDGRIQCPRVAADPTAASAAVVGDRVCVAYRNRDGYLSVDVGGRVASPFDATTPSGATTGQDGRIELGLPDVPVWANGSADAWVELGYRRPGVRSAVNAWVRSLLGRSHPPVRVPARLVPGPSGDAVARLALPDPRGTYRWVATQRSPGAPAWRLAARRGGASLDVSGRTDG
ncbi:glycosyltransferase family 2 protein [Agromyces binzhouensis]|uniref:glycosyltransferase family 2 protein n=1 Tax=Agromyces binzhouensis TaxID=1817495 RepID=UPI003626D195